MRKASARTVTGAYGNRTHQEPVSKPLTDFEDRAVHQRQTRSPRETPFSPNTNDLVQGAGSDNSGCRALGTVACHRCLTVPSNYRLGSSTLRTRNAGPTCTRRSSRPTARQREQAPALQRDTAGRGRRASWAYLELPRIMPGRQCNGPCDGCALALPHHRRTLASSSAAATNSTEV